MTKTAFQTCYGSFKWLVMPFSLTIVPVTFQRFMNDILGDLLDHCVIVYLDDILVYSDDLVQHREHIWEILKWLRQNGLFAKGNKWKWHKDSVEFLGYILKTEGLTMANDKVKIIHEWPEPWKVKDIQSFLGFANFYHHFIYNYLDISPISPIKGPLGFSQIIVVNPSNFWKTLLP